MCAARTDLLSRKTPLAEMKDRGHACKYYMVSVGSRVVNVSVNSGAQELKVCKRSSRVESLRGSLALLLKCGEDGS